MTLEKCKQYLCKAYSRKRKHDTALKIYFHPVNKNVTEYQSMTLIIIIMGANLILFKSTATFVFSIIQFVGPSLHLSK